MSAEVLPTNEPNSGRARIVFPAELPISLRVPDIAAAVNEHQVVIVAGATGSGKTTQLPKILLDMGRGTAGFIGVTQPRRIAATSVAARVASELRCELGREVGYQIRFEDRTRPETYVKFMTDGILLAEIQGDRLLRRYDTLIIDEAHERNLTIDFLLGWLKRILPERPELKLLISSATIETERFSEFFGGAPVIQVEGRTFPVEILYEPPDPELDLAEALANAVENVTSLDPRGDILVFLPGEREIREAERQLQTRNLRHTVIQPLYSRLSSGEQRKVFQSIPERRVILATNVAETSLTIPGIVYVIDSGVARLSRYEPRTGTTSLQIEAISRASADQRKGRSGRVREGICVRLYDEENFAARPAFTDPELKRSGLSGVILRMKSLGLGEIETFPFLDPPDGRAIAEGYRVLQELGALDDERALTPLGARLARFPVDPRVGRMILAGVAEGCLAEVLILAAALNIQDPRERPRGLEQKADQLQQRFRDERSDFLGLLKLWEFVREAQEKSTSELRRVCKANFLSFLRIREWSEVHRQLEDVARELDAAEKPRRQLERRDPKKHAQGELELRVHRALLTGLLSKIGQWNPEARVYLGAKQTRFLLHPSSALARKPPQWVMAFELVQTSQLFARTAAKLDPEWLDEVGQHLLKRSYSDPHWSEKSARASIRENATLFGLPVFRGRSVDYAKISPVRARLMFLEHALVRGEYRSTGAFQETNRALLAEVARQRDKARQSQLLADDEALLAFFEQRVPEQVHDGKSFETWRKTAEAKQPELLCLALKDVLRAEEQISAELYPDSITLHGAEIPLSYRFDPSAEDDGITLLLPLPLVLQLDPRELDWTIPGWHEQKITALLSEVPRALRRELGSIPELAARVARRLTPFQGPMLPELSRVASEEAGIELPESAFRLDAVPPYLRLTCRLVGEGGRTVAQSRDLVGLFEQHGAAARTLFARSAPSATWERAGITSWDFGELPEFIVRRVGGAELRAYPALIDREKSVDLCLLESAQAAAAATRLGVRRLFALALRHALSTFAARCPAPFARQAGLPASRAEKEAFRGVFLARVLDEAFACSDGARVLRNKTEFDAALALGVPRMAPACTRVERAVVAASAELQNTLRALAAAANQPSGTAARAEISAQIELLFPPDLLSEVELARLEQFPRYLRAAQARLARAITDPRKDADKLKPFAPLWQKFLLARAPARDRDAECALRWSFEELRVAIFAPELKPALPVTVGSVALALEALR
ncbi:MAG TPA: ATP-dependent RNA helicase HrpA [Polyangiaceae bacterium]|jgi:ATP-dependent helicase HrpA|nr:ATP-dependent RNA helicase HrpA [Polyangiaceae bacterium]